MPATPDTTVQRLREILDVAEVLDGLAELVVSPQFACENLTTTNSFGVSLKSLLSATYRNLTFIVVEGTEEPYVRAHTASGR